MAATNERAPGDGALGEQRVSTDDTHLTLDRHQGKSQRDRTRALLTALRAEYPVFAQYRPLAIGIHLALGAALPGTSETVTRRALAMHCRCDAYLKSLAAGGARYASDGSPCGEVSEAHRAAAVAVLSRLAKKTTPRPQWARGAAPPTPVTCVSPRLRPTLSLRRRA